MGDVGEVAQAIYCTSSGEAKVLAALVMTQEDYHPLYSTSWRSHYHSSTNCRHPLVPRTKGPNQTTNTTSRPYWQ